MKKVGFSTRTIAYTAVMTAMVAVATMVLKIQTADSYTNLGDAVIFLTAAFFGPIPALIAGGVGSFLADLLTYPTTMWFTLVIKGIEGLIAGSVVYLADKTFSSESKKSTIIKLAIYILGMILAAIWMVGGYYLAKAFSYGTKESALISLPKNCIQGGISLIVAIVLYGLLYPVAKKMEFKSIKGHSLNNESDTIDKHEDDSNNLNDLRKD